MPSVTVQLRNARFAEEEQATRAGFRDTVPAVRDCPAAGKRRYADLRQAKCHARALARSLNRSGQLASSLYAYECAQCDGLHLTRRESWDGVPHAPAYIAPTAEVQRWAMPEGGDV